MRFSFIFLCFPILFIFSCQSELDTITQATSSSCKVINGYQYYINGKIDSATYIYTNDKVTQVQIKNEKYYTLEYSGDRIVKRNFFKPGASTLEEYQLIDYNNDGSINKIERFYNLANGGQYQLLTFTHTGKNLTKIAVSTKNSGTLELAVEYIYTYTGNNINKAVMKYYYGGTMADMDSTSYLYDNKPNYLTKQSSQFLLVDPFFLNGSFVLDNYVLFLSQNNLTKSVNLIDGYSEDWTYVADDKENVTHIKIDGISALSYSYECR